MTSNIFIAGDLHIPSRATMLYPAFQEILETKIWDYIFLTGDLTTIEVLESFYSYVSSSKKVIASRGNMDQIPLPLKPVIEIEGVKFGVFHGTGISPRGDIKQLKKVAKDMGVQVLCTGHSHQYLIHSDSEHLLLNPGTSTGASGGSSWNVDTGLITLKLETNRKLIFINHYQISSKQKLNISKYKYDLG